MAAMAANLTDEDAVEAAFKKADVDNSGSLSVEELAGLVKALGGLSMEDGELAAALAALDADGSGEISMEEFVAWWKGTVQ